MKQELIKALEEIINPIKFMQQRADEQGMNLDGMYAHMISKDVGYLQSIAKKALEALEMDEYEDQIEIFELGSSVYIELPKTILQDAFELKEELSGVKIEDGDLFIKEFIRALKVHINHNQEALGLTSLQSFLDEVFVYLSESGSASLSTN